MQDSVLPQGRGGGVAPTLNLLYPPSLLPSREHQKKHPPGCVACRTSPAASHSHIGTLLLDEVCYDFSERKFVNAVALCLSWKYLPFNNG